MWKMDIKLFFEIVALPLPGHTLPTNIFVHEVSSHHQAGEQASRVSNGDDVNG